MTTCVACPYGCACPHCCGCCCVATSYGVAGTNLVRVSHCGSVKRKALPLFVSLRAFVRRSRLARERAERARDSASPSSVSPGVAKTHRTQKRQRAEQRPEQKAPQHDGDRSDVVLGQVRPVHALRVAHVRVLRAGRVHPVLPGHRVRDAGTRVRDARGVVLGRVRHVRCRRL